MYTLPPSTEISNLVTSHDTLHLGKTSCMHSHSPPAYCVISDDVGACNKTNSNLNFINEFRILEITNLRSITESARKTQIH